MFYLHAKYINFVIILQIWGANQGDQMSFWKIRPKCSPTHFGQYYHISFTEEKSCQRMWTNSILFIKLPKVNNRPIWSPWSQSYDRELHRQRCKNLQRRK
jgi:hypothetical protein